MYEIGINGLQRLMEESRAAAKYARTHYALLAARNCTHTLYGSEANFIGAAVPSSLTPARARKLTRTTRRKNHVIYELDEAYQPLRTIHVLDYNETDCTYHHFERNGVSYAYPFRGDGNGIYNDTIVAQKYSQGRAEYFAIVSDALLFVQFYEYEDTDTMNVSTYRYWPTAKFTMHGYPVDWNAPLGAPNSPVQRHCIQEPINNIDFSQWFKDYVPNNSI